MILDTAVGLRTRYRITIQAYALVTVEFSHKFIKLTLINLQVFQKNHLRTAVGTVLCFSLHLTAWLRYAYNRVPVHIENI